MRASVLFMSYMSTRNLVNHCFNYVVDTSKLLNIDESHAVKHAMDVYRTSNLIYESEVEKFPYLENQRNIIYSAAIGHDMCDKKYVEEKEAVKMYQSHLSHHMTNDELDVMGKIISTMSYSKVKVNGYPKLDNYQLSYHIVREADLLTSYDIDRCIIYGMYNENLNYSQSVNRAINLFDDRVFKLRSDKLFVTNYSKKESMKLHKRARVDVESLLRSLHL